MSYIIISDTIDDNTFLEYEEYTDALDAYWQTVKGNPDNSYLLVRAVLDSNGDYVD